MKDSTPALAVSELGHRYGTRQVLEGLSFQIEHGCCFGWLGPNGSGKTTLFRLLATLLPVQQGTLQVCGFDVRQQPLDVRRSLGVTFQSPSLDRKLTVRENLQHQGHLYGLSGQILQQRIKDVLEHLRLLDRQGDLVQTLSGGLQRRVEIAKALLHHPRVLLLDEPSTGLDPRARLELWQYLRELRESLAVTIVVTTHLLDEAEQCDRVGILHRGKLVAEGPPAELRQKVGGDCLLIQTPNPEPLAVTLRTRFSCDVTRVGDTLRIETSDSDAVWRILLAEYRPQLTSITWGKPTLEDVFVHQTGERFEDTSANEGAAD